MNEKNCLLCGAASLRVIADYARLPRVTSDCKPWSTGGQLAVCETCGMVQKPPDKTWLSEIGEIYGAYDLFYLNTTPDQMIFGAGEPRGRTEILVDYVVSQGALPGEGKLLDVGCGKGTALAKFCKALPDWKLYGNELSDKTLPLLQKIPRFEQLYVGEVADINESFSVVTLIHSLEHLIDPAAALGVVRDKIATDGKLVIQVPDVDFSPFDLLVADHRSHFSAQTLHRLVTQTGFNVMTLSNKTVPKELTLIATLAVAAVTQPAQAAAAVQRLEIAVRWLARVADALRHQMDQGPVVIFGTAVAGMAMYGLEPDRIAGFVDEDTDRQGKKYDGKPVYAPADVPRDVTVFIPLMPETAAKVAARLRPTGLKVAEPPAYMGA